MKWDVCRTRSVVSIVKSFFNLFFISSSLRFDENCHRSKQMLLFVRDCFNYESRSSIANVQKKSLFIDKMSENKVNQRKTNNNKKKHLNAKHALYPLRTVLSEKRRSWTISPIVLNIHSFASHLQIESPSCLSERIIFAHYLHVRILNFSIFKNWIIPYVDVEFFFLQKNVCI